MIFCLVSLFGLGMVGHVWCLIRSAWPRVYRSWCGIRSRAAWIRWWPNVRLKRLPRARSRLRWAVAMDDAARFYAAEAAKVIQAFFHAAALTGHSIDDVMRWWRPRRSLANRPRFCLSIPMRRHIVCGCCTALCTVMSAPPVIRSRPFSLLFQEDIRRRCVPSRGRQAPM
jgi:hypothetical protein